MTDDREARGFLAGAARGGGRMEDQIREAIIDELKRQAEIIAELEVRKDGDRVVVNGPIDIDALVMVVAGSVAGGP
jgi:hypothetical protein